jgi:sugar transferase (PEP-CTERM system associated)
MKVLLDRLTLRSATLVVFESAVIFAALTGAILLRFGAEGWEDMISEGLAWRALLATLVCQLSLYYNELYDFKVLSDRREVIVRLIRALGITSFALAAIQYWFPNAIIGRGVFVIGAFLVGSLLVGWRFAFELLSSSVAPRERLLLVGTSPAALALARELHELRHKLGVQIVGFIDPDPARVGQPLINPGIVGTIDDIPSVVRARGVDRVVVSLAEARGALPMDKLLEMKLEGVAFDHLASVYEEYTGKIAVENLRPSWLIFSDGFRKSVRLSALKRTMDLVVGLVGLIVAIPLCVAVAIAVRLSSPGPILYSQRRVGRHGRVFTVHKFRSMKANAEATTGAVWAQRDDPRITSVGRFLRRTRLDELPQLWNVLVGDMSFVGPRPERPEFVSELTKQIPFYGQRHIIRPGLTGWAQVRYSYGASTEDAMEKLQYDLYYIKNMSLSLDVFVILATIKTVLLRRGA